MKEKQERKSNSKQRTKSCQTSLGVLIVVLKLCLKERGEAIIGMEKILGQERGGERYERNVVHF